MMCKVFNTFSSLFMMVFVLLASLQAAGNDHDNSQALTYTNPIMDIKAADPHVIRYEGSYYLYPTWGGTHYDVFTSSDLLHWEHKGKCFEDSRGGLWAPDVFHHASGDGKFYLYYTIGPLRHKQVGVAVSESPLGPFEDRCILADNAIDAHLFRDDDGELYLYYTEIFAEPGNRIRVQAMKDPLQKKGESHLIITPEAPWERAHGFVAEAPWMIKRNGVYYLMYSGSGADGPGYAIGYATADSPKGPFTKYPGNPIVKRTETVFGPGHHCVIEGPRGGLWMVYHQKKNTDINFTRFLALDPIWFDEEGVIHATVSRGTEQPAP